MEVDRHVVCNQSREGTLEDLACTNEGYVTFGYGNCGRKSSMPECLVFGKRCRVYRWERGQESGCL